MNVKKYIGDRQFYKTVLTIAIPIMVQNGISNFVSMLDNLMIGRLGTNELSGVAIANQIIFVYYLVIFGATAGVGIFTAQYHGMGNVEGERNTFRVKLIINTTLSVLCILFFYFNAEALVSLFLKGEGSPADAVETLGIGVKYMGIMLVGLTPIAFTQAYAGTLRDTGQTRIPMLASLTAMLVNLVGNLILIYGLLGFPALGAAGAAIATVISRFVELAFLIIYTAVNSDKHPFIIGAFRHFNVSGDLFMKFFIKSLPLIANETLWALGQTTMNQCYSYRSLIAVAALNIENTIWFVFSVAFVAMGDAAGIIVGQILGSGDIEKARDTAAKMRAFTVMCGLVFGLFMIIVSPLFPLLYNTSDEVRSLASTVIFIYGLLMAPYAYTHVSYFILRSGGNTLVTFLFDSCFVWVVSVPSAFILSRFTQVPIIPMVAIVQSLELIKCVIGGVMVKSGVWAKNIVDDNRQKT